MLENSDYPYKFDELKCAMCDGNCCIGESGYIWITKKEIENLAKYLNITIDELAQKFIFKVGYKFSIREKLISKDNYACVFFDLTKKQCSIYEVRPSQCRTFPFWEYFKNNIEEVKEECPAIVE
jgi:uncharacterized protein